MKNLFVNKQLFSILSAVIISSFYISVAELQQQNLMPSWVDATSVGLVGVDYPHVYTAWKTKVGTFEGTYEEVAYAQSGVYGKKHDLQAEPRSSKVGVYIYE